MDVNSIVITGRLGHDAELRYSRSGTPILSFRVANDIYAGGDTRTTWYAVTVFGKRAEQLNQLDGALVTGARVAVRGQHTTREYQDKDGRPRTSNEIIADDIALLGQRSDRPMRTDPPQDGEGNSALPF